MAVTALNPSNNLFHNGSDYVNDNRLSSEGLKRKGF